MKHLAIIPARSGSKGLKNKNIINLCGKPLMAYTIEAAIESKMFDEIMVSTDSEEYAKIAQSFGASIPFLRSDSTSTDGSSSWAMVKEVINNYKMNHCEFDTFCLLQPTSPLRDAKDIVKAYSIYEQKKAISVISLCECEHSPLWMGQLSDGNGLENFLDRGNNIQRQSLKKFYRLNGAIYIANVREFEKDNYLFRQGSYAYIMDNTSSVDIDSEFDLKFAEFLLKNK